MTDERRTDTRRAPRRPRHDQGARPSSACARPTRACSQRQEDPGFVHTDPWRVLRIMGEFVDGFDALARVGRAVTVFGSARVKPDSPLLRRRRARSARGWPRRGFAVITGGGPGIMEAANRGAREAGGLSIG